MEVLSTKLQSILSKASKKLGTARDALSNSLGLPTADKLAERKKSALIAQQHAVLNNSSSNPFSQLPDETILHILSYLSAIDVLHGASRVCTEWYRLTQDDKLWHEFFLRDQPTWWVFCGGHSYDDIESPSESDPNYALNSSRGTTIQKAKALVSSTLDDIFHLIFEDDHNSDAELHSGADQTNAASGNRSNADTLVSVTVRHNSSWKLRYRAQFIENRTVAVLRKPNATPPAAALERRSASRGGLLPALASPLSAAARLVGSGSSRKVYRVPMFGEGMETSAKSLLYEMMWAPHSPFTVTRLYPGVEGLGSGVGFDVPLRANAMSTSTPESIEMSLAALYKYDDRGVFRSADAPNSVNTDGGGGNAQSGGAQRPLWRQYFRTADAFVFVVDDTMATTPSAQAEAQQGLSLFVNDDTAPAMAPLLVLHLTNGSDGQVMSPAEMALRLGLMQRHRARMRPWSVRQVDSATLRGTAEGLSWLAEQIVKQQS